MLFNTKERYGWFSISLHWLVALTIFGLFGLGFWMVELNYYSEWYRTAPDIHKSVGILLAVVMLVRVVLKIFTTTPHPLGESKLENLMAKMAHALLYLLIILVLVTGYFISTADGRPISVFEWFSVPAYPLPIENQEDVSGFLHKWLAYSLVGLALFHALAAFKHHFIQKDRTLLRMFGK